MSNSTAPTATTARLRSPRGPAEHPLRLLAAAALLLPLVVFATASWIAYDRAFVEARTRLDRTLDLVHEHAVKVFETHDLVVEQANQIVLGLSDAEIKARGPELHDRLSRLGRRLPQVTNLWVLDAAGRPLVSSAISPIPATLDLSDRDYFRVHRAGAVPRGQDYVGEIIDGRALRKTAFQVSTARDTGVDATAFAGVVAVSANPGYFRHFYGEVARGGGVTTMALMRADGAVLVRFPPISDERGRRAPAGPVMRGIAVEPERGTVEGRSDLDGVERIVAYRRLPGWAVYVTAGIDRAVVVRGWIAAMGAHLLFGIPATAGLVALSLVALRRTRREASALASLRAEVARRQEMEEQLRQAQKMEAVGRLTGGIAHDFNNLLQIILGSLDLLGRRMTNGDERLRRLVESAREGAVRAAALTQRLLAFSRRQPLDPRPLDPNKLVSGMSELLRRTLPETVRIETVLGGGLWLSRADPNQLESALLNLAVNARDAMPDGGRLTIETANAHLDEAYAARRGEVAAGQYVLLAVTDTGAGMSADVIAKAFEPFFTTKALGSGTGLGLSQVYGFAKQSGGHAALYSEVGRGTTVKLYLPRYVGAEEVAEAATADPVRAHGSTTVLVVEDEEGVRRFAVEALNELGYDVLEADCGPAALRLMAAHPEIGLLLTDVVMPDMDGRRLASEALKLRPDLKVVFATGYTRNAIVHNGVLDPGTHLISKPFTLAQIATKLDELLHAPRDAARSREWGGRKAYRQSGE